MKLLEMRATYFAILVAVFLSFAHFESLALRQNADDDPYKVERFNVSPGGEIYVKTSGGSIKVEGSGTSEVVVEVYVRSGRWDRDRAIREVEENYRIQIDKSGNRVEVIAEKKSASWSGNGVSVSFVAKVPKRFDCELLTSGGSLSLKNVEGREQVLKTSGGSIHLEEIGGAAEAKTSGGSISVVGMHGPLNARTSGGSIKLEDVSGDVDVATSGGGIRLVDVSGSVEASTSGGSINADMPDLRGQLILQTSGGSVTASIPSGLGIDLDLKGNRVNAALNNFNGRSEKDRVVGSMNGGGIPVKMATSGGSINLNFK